MTDPHRWLKSRLPSERPAGRLQPLEPPKARERGGLKPRSDREGPKARRAEQFGPQARLARRSPCGCCNNPPPSDPAHWPSRGAGGKDCDVLPLCPGPRGCHRRSHDQGEQTFAVEFERRTGFPPDEGVRRMRDRLREHNCEAWPEQTKRGLRCAICWGPIDERELARP